MNHPYEKLGIITSVVILVAILAVGMVMMNAQYEHDKASSVPSSGGIDDSYWKSPPVVQNIPELPKYSMDYYYENQAKQKCKVLADNLQQFSDCVNFGFVCVEWDNKLKCSLTTAEAGFGSGSGGSSNP